MSVYKNILVAIDLSDESQQVVDRAMAIAGVGDQLALVHVVRPIEHVYGGFGAVGLAGDFSEQMATLEQQASAHAQQKLKDLGTVLGVPESRQFTPIGHAATEIQRVAGELGADLIVIGTHGRHGLGLLLGSTANGVLHGVKRDVLAVRVHAPEA